jgi:solute carrier family 25 2-oxodicarboxylate transporter 21
VSEVPRRALKFSSNHAYKRALVRPGAPSWAQARRSPANIGGAPELSVAGAVASGSLTGATETLLHTPFEVLKVRLQSPDYAARYRGALGGVSALVREEGVGGLYHGVGAYALRQGLWNGTFFGLVAAIRQGIGPPTARPTPADGTKLNGPKLNGSKLAYDFWTGLAAGTAATIANTPLDVVKTRIQNASSRDGPQPHARPISSRPWVVLGLLYRDEGLGACFKGLNARLCRSAPGSGILLLGYEAIKSLLEAD